jgi:hypothetical protein
MSIYGVPVFVPVFVSGVRRADAGRLVLPLERPAKANSGPTWPTRGRELVRHRGRQRTAVNVSPTNGRCFWLCSA